MSEDNWYYSRDGQTYGPFSFDALTQMVGAGLLDRQTQVARAGEQIWRPYEAAISVTRAAGNRSSKGSDPMFVRIAGKISQASGLEKLEDFSILHLFSQVLRKHSPEEIEEHFSAGTATTTPRLSHVVAHWPTPWAFFRLLGLSLLASLTFYWAIARFANPMLIPGWIFVGCFGMPFAVLVFFIESNILKNISFYRVLTLLFLGGLLSLIVSLFLFEYTKLHSWMGAMSAGLIEEFGKLLAVVFFTRKWNSFSWILNGILLGAAVGTGFSAFESAGYVFVSLHSGGDLGAEATMALRAFLSPFTHTIWTAATVAALWRVRNGRTFEWGMLLDIRFLRVFAIIAGLHTVWNSPITIPFMGDFTGYILSRLIIGLIGWIVILLLIQSGFKQIRVAQAN